MFSCATASLGMCQKHVPEACLVWSSCCSGICVQVLQPLNRFSGLCLLNLLCVSVVLFWHMRWLDAANESIPKIWHMIWNFMALLHVFWCAVAPESISEASSWRKRRVLWRMLRVLQHIPAYARPGMSFGVPEHNQPYAKSLACV